LTEPAGVDPLLAGLRGRCPRCGEGALFTGFLGIVPTCRACGLDLARADSGDGPAVFVIIIVGFLVVFAALFTEVAVHPPIWLHLVLWLPLAAILCLALLRPLKGLMIAAQIRNKASEHRRDDAA
jgi:uncharacterized protein (DUF983 family)